MGVRLLGDRSEAGGLGEGHVPAAVRDRDEFSSNEPMPNPHDDQEVPCAVLLCGDRVVAEEPVGVASLLRAVEPASRVSEVQLGPPTGGTHADLAGRDRQEHLWTNGTDGAVTLFSGRGWTGG